MRVAQLTEIQTLQLSHCLSLTTAVRAFVCTIPYQQTREQNDVIIAALICRTHGALRNTTQRNVNVKVNNCQLIAGTSSQDGLQTLNVRQTIICGERTSTRRYGNLIYAVHQELHNAPIERQR